MDSPENIFAQRNQEWANHAAQWEIDDLPESSQTCVDSVACSIIIKENIIDDTEKRKIYDSVKQQYLEHRKQRETKSINETSHKLNDNLGDFDEGYKAFWESLKRVEEYEVSQYNKGYEAAKQEYLASKEETKQVAIEVIKSDGVDGNKDELREIKEEIKKLDERLKRLEKYTQE